MWRRKRRGKRRKRNGSITDAGVFRYPYGKMNKTDSLSPTVLRVNTKLTKQL